MSRTNKPSTSEMDNLTSRLQSGDFDKHDVFERTQDQLLVSLARSVAEESDQRLRGIEASVLTELKAEAPMYPGSSRVNFHIARIGRTVVMWFERVGEKQGVG